MIIPILAVGKLRMQGVKWSQNNRVGMPTESEP